jgi:hypothetical protein
MKTAKKTLAVRVDAKHLLRIEQIAAQESCSVSDVVRGAIAEHFERADLYSKLDDIEHRLSERMRCELRSIESAQSDVQRFVQNINKNVITTYKQLESSGTDLSPVLSKLDAQSTQLDKLYKLASKVYARVRGGLFRRLRGV